MEKCGDYITDKVVGWGRSATYYTGFAGDEAGEARVIVRCARSTDRRHLIACSFAAAEQQTATSNGCRRLAPILDFGISDSGRAYYVTLGYESSVGEGIEAGNSIDATSLKDIVTGTLQALTELRDKFHRAHGNLTAGNVLLDKKGGVVLTDLSHTSKEASHAADLRALGHIIYQLVQGSLNVGFLAPPLERSVKWTDALEDQADDWREFTNRMLGCKAGGGTDILQKAWDDLKGLSSLAEKAAPVPIPVVSTSGTHSTGQRTGTSFTTTEARPAKKGPFKAILASVVALLCGTGGFVYWQKSNSRKEEQNVVPVPELGMRDLLKLVPANLKDKLGDDEKYIADSIAAATTPAQIESHLRGLKTPKRLEDLGNVWEKRGTEWQKLAELLKVKPNEDLEGSARVAEALKELPRMADLYTIASALEREWNSVKSAYERLGKREVPGLPSFQEWANAEIESSNDVATAFQKTKKAKESLVDLEKAIDSAVGRIQIEAFKRNGHAILDFRKAQVPSNWPLDWKTKLSDSLKPEDKDVAEWKKAYAEIERRIASRGQGERPALTKQLDEVRADAAKAVIGEVPGIHSRLKALKDTIRDPLLDMIAEVEQLFVKLRSDVAAAPDTNAGKSLVDRFKTDTGEALKKSDYSTVSASFKRGSLDPLLVRFDKALETQEETKFNFAAGRWTPGPRTPKSATFTFEGSEITFHILTTSAIASMETPLKLAKLTRANLEPPDASPGRGGPLSNRDMGPGRDAWLWPEAEQWKNEHAKQLRLNPGKKTFDQIFPHAASPEECPLTWVSGLKAAEIANRMGCRLPTRDEWGAAKALPQRPGVKLAGNLLNQAKTEITFWDNATPPITSFAPLPRPFTYKAGGPTLNSPISVDERNLLWLAPATNNPAAMNDLIGNAGEWVRDGDTFYVVGGSFATPSTVNFTQPVEVNGGTRYYDVSFRLAVDLTPGSQNAGLEMLKTVIADAAAKGALNR